MNKSNVSKSNEHNRMDRYEALVSKVGELIGIQDLSDMRVLVVGAGDGREALALSARCPRLTAIEPAVERLINDAKPLVQSGDATCLAFKDGSFDLVYCYHVLEHIPDCGKAISEMHRVLADGGSLYLGVPNKRRLIAYVLVKDNTLWEKISWNLKDWKFKLMGRFENRHGAHAGFTSEELQGLLGKVFPNVVEVTRDYYILNRPNSRITRVISRLKALSNFVWPSLYFVCRK